MQDCRQDSVAAAIRRRWLLAVWVAEKMGLYGPMAELYARNLKAVSDPCMTDAVLLESLDADLSSMNIQLGKEALGSELHRINEIIEQKIL